MASKSKKKISNQVKLKRMCLPVVPWKYARVGCIFPLPQDRAGKRMIKRHHLMSWRKFKMASKGKLTN
ncbi:hypothetical protein I79_010308 [Cricetulus griseus]|uniref:Uncharacterized protein n=1 Tax=Cricetulus griseus TaxID=10029 RepID=G3HI44_CRIGR|nr:hypothetical protein I79_010308 [Cricetulus griseus]